MFTRPRTATLTLVLFMVLMGCGGNRGEGDEGQTVKVPGDSVRLEDTLSAPPPSDSARAQ